MSYRDLKRGSAASSEARYRSWLLYLLVACCTWGRLLLIPAESCWYVPCDLTHSRGEEGSRAALLYKGVDLLAGDCAQCCPAQWAAILDV